MQCCTHEKSYKKKSILKRNNFNVYKIKKQSQMNRTYLSKN